MLYREPIDNDEYSGQLTLEWFYGKVDDSGDCGGCMIVKEDDRLHKTLGEYYKIMTHNEELIEELSKTTELSPKYKRLLELQFSDTVDMQKILVIESKIINALEEKQGESIDDFNKRVQEELHSQLSDEENEYLALLDKCDNIKPNFPKKELTAKEIKDRNDTLRQIVSKIMDK